MFNLTFGLFACVDFYAVLCFEIVYYMYFTDMYINLFVCVLKGVLHPNTKISMFCLFSPSSRRKLILIGMIVIDMCDSKSKSMAFFSWIYESLMWNDSKYFFPFHPKKSL